MARTIKFRAWDTTKKRMTKPFNLPDIKFNLNEDFTHDDFIMQFTGVVVEGQDLYEDDIVEFTDKWEWYRGTYGIAMMFATPEKRKEIKANYDAEPMHRIKVEIDPFEGVNLSRYDLGESRYKIIGNIYENPELISH